jgi:thiamine transport system permease protein
VQKKQTNRVNVWPLALPPVLAVVFCFLVPYGASFWNAFRGGVTVWGNPALFAITLFTLKQAFFSVLVSLAIGLPGAWFIGAGRSRLLRALTAIPFAMPSILVVLGFVLFYGNSGWVNRFIAFFQGDPLRILYRPGAIILAHGFLNFPLVIRLAGDGIERARRAYVPAAAALGASPFVSALTVVLPLTFPALIPALLLAFLYSFTSFGVVLVLGGVKSTTLSVEIYRQARVFLNYPNAGALALVETLIALSVFVLFVLLGKKSREQKTEMEERIMERNSRSLPSRIIMTGYCVFAALFVLGPVFSVVWESFFYRPSRSSSALFSLKWWLTLGETCLPAFSRSIVLAVFSASFACALAILGAGAVKFLEDRGGTFGANLVRFCGAAPVISSGIILALGWMTVYGGKLTRAPLALIMLHSLIALPFAFNSVSEGFRSLPANILNASLVSGAGPFRSLLTTALPISLPRLRSAWGFAAALSLGELNAAMMLGWETLPLYIYRAAGAYRYGTAAAAGTLLIIGCCAGLLLSERGSFRYGS